MYKGDKWQYYDCIEITARFMLKQDKDAYMVDIDDLITAGLEVLDTCEATYDYDKGCAFRTYLVDGLKLRYLNEIRKYKNRYNKYIADAECATEYIVDYAVSVEKQVISKIITAEREHQLMRAFKFVLETYRDMWVAYYYEDLTLRDIAWMNGISFQRVKQIIDNVSTKLLYILENNEKFVY